MIIWLVPRSLISGLLIIGLVACQTTASSELARKIKADGADIQKSDTTGGGILDAISKPQSADVGFGLCGIAAGQPIAIVASSPCRCSPLEGPGWTCVSHGGRGFMVLESLDGSCVQELVIRPTMKGRDLKTACDQYDEIVNTASALLGPQFARRDDGCFDGGSFGYFAASLWRNGDAFIRIVIDNHVEDASLHSIVIHVGHYDAC